MEGLKTDIKERTINWLLEEDNPSVRFVTLTKLLGYSKDDVIVIRAAQDIMSKGPVPIILSKQYPEGYWIDAENFYMYTKYKGTVWQLIILAELEANGAESHIKKACEYILEHSQDPESGGFAYQQAENSRGDHQKILPCLTGNIIWSLIKFGYLNDLRVQQGIDWITSYQRFDDGIEIAPRGWPYERKKCWGAHTCHMGVVKALKALVEIPENRRNANIKKTLEQGAEYILNHHIFKRSHNLNHISILEWTKFGFPHFWNTDVLEILWILTKLAYKDERMQEAIELMLSKQNDAGQWILESSFNTRMVVNIEKVGFPSKWMTLKALLVLKEYYNLSIKYEEILNI